MVGIMAQVEKEAMKLHAKLNEKDATLLTTKLMKDLEELLTHGSLTCL